ncbi:hypothetical protein [Bradyrhizobium sp. 6(2017)]|uniref:hypothetical protein n=1 Tax=Bradyrhizobium sp. 6(2017) TaxID=1197460 RepID=UPI0013E12B85|nr:hypothetical protein [Bradyrhizobium sp. 6(2017)]QIG92877.1 hypothetical protein G6P99_10405 [Bradyrhizobium sp. 6(2017)]
MGDPDFLFYDETHFHLDPREGRVLIGLSRAETDEFAQLNRAAFEYLINKVRQGTIREKHAATRRRNELLNKHLQAMFALQALNSDVKPVRH